MSALFPHQGEHLAEDHARFTKLIAGKPRAAVFGDLKGAQLQGAPRPFGVDHPAADLRRYK